MVDTFLNFSAKGEVGAVMWSRMFWRRRVGLFLSGYDCEVVIVEDGTYRAAITEGTGR